MNGKKMIMAMARRGLGSSVAFMTILRGVALVAAALGIGNLSAGEIAEGAVAGWLRPEGDASGSAVLFDEKGARTAGFCLYKHDFARADIVSAEKGGEDFHYSRAIGRLVDRTDEWVRFIFSWDRQGTVRYYINGRSFVLGAFAFGMERPLVGSAIGASVRAEAFRGCARDIELLKRAVGPDEAMRDFRRWQPVDLVMADSVVPPGVRTNVFFRLAPGGHYTRPNPSEAYSDVKTDVTVSTRITRIVRRGNDHEFVAVEGGETKPETVRVDGVKDIPAASCVFDAGEYRLQVTFHGKEGDFVRTLFFTAQPPCSNAGRAETKAPLRKGRILAERTFAASSDADFQAGDSRPVATAAGSYLEAGGLGGNRFGAVLTLPPEALGKPCLLEVDWPDDRERAFSLFMYEEMANSCRDHLQMGIAAGGVVPSTGRMQTSEYIYWPNTTNQLFEARTVIESRPAAVAAIRLRMIEGPLPKLRIHRPEGLPSRTFGHCDEDQTFVNNLTSQTMDAPLETVLPRLVDYFAYTGQDALHYSTMRYGNMYFGHADGVDTNPMFPLRKGELGELVRALGRCGIRFVPQAFYAGDPTLCVLDQCSLRDGGEGCESLDDRGRPCKVFGFGDRAVNIANPVEQERFLGQFADFLVELCERGCDRVDVCLENEIAAPFCWPRPEVGYDDWTVRRFADEAGRRAGAAWEGLKPLLGDAKSEADYRARYDLLWKGALRKEWIAWRAEKVTEFFSRFCDRLRKARPDVRIVTEVSGNPDRYETRGVDLGRIAAIPNVELATIRMNNTYWFKLSRGEEEPSDLEDLYDPESSEVRRLMRFAGGSVPQVFSYPVYFETFEKPVGGDPRFGSYFQNSDLHPWGRFYLREQAYAVGMMDALNYAIGMQPLGTWGAETEAREFAQAYCALPAIPFRDMEGSSDPVVGRFLATANGTYFYLVNQHCTALRARLGERVRCLDLSTDAESEADVFELKPYQLRSFLVKGAKAGSMRVAAEIPDASRALYDERRAEVRAALKTFREKGIDGGAAQETFDRAERLLAEGRLAAAHRLYWSRPLNSLASRLGQIENVLKEREMNAAGRWAVNCGQTAYSTAGGRLFSPDRAWDGRTYGRLGAKTLSTNRDLAAVRPDAAVREVYATEAYMLDGYRFRLPPGAYSVRLYVKWGFAPTFENPRTALPVEYFVNGKSVAGPFDFVKRQNHDIRNVVELFAETVVGDDGILEIGIETPGDKSLALLNAIEIEKR